jgi:pyruvate dehydrogenase E1 component beta subunit
MFGGIMKVPIVVRMILGRGWGQGPQHSQNLHAWFAHIPGLKVVMPATVHDAKGMMIAAIEDDNPVIFIDHRWLHHVKGHVPEGHYTVPLGPARVAREGNDVTIVAFSYMVLEAMEAASKLAVVGIDAEVIDFPCLRPFDVKALLASVRKTRRLVVADAAWSAASMSAETLALVSEHAHAVLRSAPRRVCLPDCPTPTTPALADYYYPRSGHIVAAVRETMGLASDASDIELPVGVELDKPNPAFTGPF